MKKSFCVCVFGISIVLIAVQFYLRAMPVTGDEPGYIYKALSFWQTGGFHMPLVRFGQELPQFEPLVRARVDMGWSHPILMPIIASPVVNLFGVAGARAISVICAVGAIIFISGLLYRKFNVWASLLAMGFMVFTFPVLPASHVFYPGIMMMFLVSASWALSQRVERFNLLLAVLFALLLPFAHIRASTLSVMLVAFAVYPLWQRRDWRGLMAACCLCGFGAGLFFTQQLVLFGHLVAGGSETYTPSFEGFFSRLAVQLLGFRHGLLVVNPACMLAFAGLLFGLLKRSKLALQGCMLLLVHLPIMVWASASESWSARYWVPLMPVLAVGMAFWLVNVRGIPARLAGIGLILASLFNSLILLVYNGSFLDDRFGYLAGDFHSPLRNHFDIAGLLPWDSFDFFSFRIDPALKLDERLMMQAVLFCVLLLLAFLINSLGSARWVKWSTWLPIIVLIKLLSAMSMRPIPANEVMVKSEVHEATLKFSCPASVRIIRILPEDGPLMLPPEYPNRLEVIATTKGGRSISWNAPFSPILGIPPGKYSSIRLIASGGDAEKWQRITFAPLAWGLVPLKCN